MDWTLKFLIFFEACILIGAAALVWKAYKSMRRVCKNKDTEIEYLRYTVKQLKLQREHLRQHPEQLNEIKEKEY